MAGRPGIAGIIAACKRARRQMRGAALVVASVLPRIAALRDHKLIFQSQLSLLQHAAAGAPPPQESFPHARSTSKFGEILWRANDAARARNALDALGGDALTRAQTLGDGVLQRSKAQSSSKDGSQHGDLLAPKRSPDFEGVLLWECADAISKATPAATKSACSTRMRSRELH